MLATLFLQLSPVDILDDTLTRSATLLPEPDAQAESGFANLLRLRVDAATPQEFAGPVLLSEGELLPQGGNILPQAGSLPSIPVTLGEPGLAGEEIARHGEALPIPVPPIAPTRDKEPLPAAKPGPATKLPNDLELRGVRPDLVLRSPVIYPPHASANTAPLGQRDTHLTPRLSAAEPLRVVPPDIEARMAAREGHVGVEPRSVTQAATPVSRPGLTALTQEPGAVAGERIDAAITRVDLRERGERGLPPATPFVESGPRNSPEGRSLPAVVLPQAGTTSPPTAMLQAGDISKKPVQTDASQHRDLSASYRSDKIRDSAAEVIRPSGVTPQPLQASSGQPGAQPSQVLQAQASETVVAPSPMASSAGDARYSAVVTQATDLISTPLRDASWGEQINERVLVMAARNLQSAEIRLTPAELGPVRVRVSVDDGAANVTFHAQHAVTRDALEQAIPRLRDMLAENGLSLGHADVAEQGVAQRDKDGQAAGQQSSATGDDVNDAGTDDERQAGATPNEQNGFVDTFA